MANKHYVTAERWMSRLYVNIGGLAKDMGFCFFNSMKEYDDLAKSYNWNKDGATGTSWCTKPVPVDVVIGVRCLRTLAS